MSDKKTTRVEHRQPPPARKPEVEPVPFEEVKSWPVYQSTWPGCTWVWLYHNPYPLRWQLDHMALADFDVGTVHRENRLRSWQN